MGALRFYPFVRLNVDITQWMGQGDPEKLSAYVNEIEKKDPEVYNNLFNNIPSDHPVPRT